MCFFDLETTGLSGGTGTVAFLATLGRFTAMDNFSTSQYFMDDYPGEPAMIHRLAMDLSKAESIVTYNGGSFDLPLFRTRCIMNGLRPPELSRHLDLLTVARRLWRVVLPDCSLGTIEREILSIDRGPDLPGSAIPERWFSYLRGGKEAREALDLVFSHNDHDVRTLALLLVMLAVGLVDGQVFKADPVGLAVLLGRSSPELALGILEAALANGEVRAIKPLMRIYWKAGRRQERMSLVPQLPDDTYGLYMKSVHAEKLDRDLESAINLADQALAQASGNMAIRLEQRLKRLRSLWEGNKTDG
ncbi:MAG: ribonuclease H-like domain-containing protein [Spirochaetota bacterium]